MFRSKEMTDPDLLKVLNEEYAPQLKKWYADVTGDDSKANVISDKITFEDWLRVVNAQDLCGVWEAEQLSEKEFVGAVLLGGTDKQRKRSNSFNRPASRKGSGGTRAASTGRPNARQQQAW